MPILVVALAASSLAARPARAAEAAVPRAVCGAGSAPEAGRQGRVSAEDTSSGRAAKGYTCNTVQVGQYGTSGGYKVWRYVDRAGHECAYYDTTLLWPGSVSSNGSELPGVFVLDMSNPAKPVRTETLVTPAMQSPHESMSLNVKRGLLAAGLGNPFTGPGQFDLYDLTADCRHPVLKTSLPLGILGHEGNFAPDGKTFYMSSTGGSTVTAIDTSDPTLAHPIWATGAYRFHGLSVSDDGSRLYAADLGQSGLTILDVSQVQARKTNPEVPLVSHMTWPDVSIPQVPWPVTIGGHPYLVEVDEFASGNALGSYDASAHVGGARIIDIVDDRAPKVVSTIKLEVNLQANRQSQTPDAGATSGLQGYAGHYCSVPSRIDPGVVACSFILSGLRLFDIRDPLKPREIAYFNAGTTKSSYAMSAPAFVPERGEIWYSDGNKGFYAVRVTNKVWPFGPLTPAPQSG